MLDHMIGLLVPAVALIAGLIGTYVGLQNHALLAEVRREIAELENRFLQRINGSFVRTSECHVREDGVQRQFAAMVADITAKASAAMLRDEGVAVADHETGRGYRDENHRRAAT